MSKKQIRNNFDAIDTSYDRILCPKRASLLMGAHHRTAVRSRLLARPIFRR